ncbi:hypothetical protein [Desulfonema magnum]|uniref:hypothetical protein n=1 Tax=Desulfonema magnum TaxID=45655 RepID=UPI001A9AD20E|nr:hypothetical protein [Desulfonema magnum]
MDSCFRRNDRKNLIIEYQQMEKALNDLVPTLCVTAIKLSFRSAKIIFRILAGKCFCHF